MNSENEASDEEEIVCIDENSDANIPSSKRKPNLNKILSSRESFILNPSEGTSDSPLCKKTTKDKFKETCESLNYESTIFDSTSDDICFENIPYNNIQSLKTGPSHRFTHRLIDRNLYREYKTNRVTIDHLNLSESDSESQKD